MSRDHRHTPKPQTDPAAAQPFDSVEQAWFWFIQAQQARIDGARTVPGNGLIPRACEPVDILKALDGLYRARVIGMDHLLVMRHYGRRMLAPDPRRAREIRSYRLWTEGLERLSKVLEDKKIVKPQGLFPGWLYSANVISIDSYREAAK